MLNRGGGRLWLAGQGRNHIALRTAPVARCLVQGKGAIQANQAHDIEHCPTAATRLLTALLCEHPLLTALLTALLYCACHPNGTPIVRLDPRTCSETAARPRVWQRCNAPRGSPTTGRPQRNQGSTGGSPRPKTSTSHALFVLARANMRATKMPQLLNS